MLGGAAPECHRHVVGASLGAGVATGLALSGSVRVESLLLCPHGGSLFAELTPALAAFIAGERSALERGDLDAAVEANLSTWVIGPGGHAADVDPAVKGLLIDPACDPDRLARRGASALDGTPPTLPRPAAWVAHRTLAPLTPSVPPERLRCWASLPSVDYSTRMGCSSRTTWPGAEQVRRKVSAIASLSEPLMGADPPAVTTARPVSTRRSLRSWR